MASPNVTNSTSVRTSNFGTTVPNKYKVASGDSLSSILKKYGITDPKIIQQIEKDNWIGKNGKIIPGEVIDLSSTRSTKAGAQTLKKDLQQLSFDGNFTVKAKRYDLGNNDYRLDIIRTNKNGDGLEKDYIDNELNTTLTLKKNGKEISYKNGKRSIINEGTTTTSYEYNVDGKLKDVESIDRSKIPYRSRLFRDPALKAKEYAYNKNGKLLRIAVTNPQETVITQYGKNQKKELVAKSKFTGSCWGIEDQEVVAYKPNGKVDKFNTFLYNFEATDIYHKLANHFYENKKL